MKEPQGFRKVLKRIFPFKGGNASGIPDSLRRGAKPIVDRFAGVLSVLWEDKERGLFILNSGGETRPSALGRVFELNPALWAP